MLGPRQATAQASLAAPAAPASTPLSDAQIERLVAPYAGAPPAALGVVFDASRYPADIADAKVWLDKPEADRGAPKETWPPSVRRLAERAPQVVDHLAADMASTSALGAAYQNQPNQVWQAYGKTTAQLQANQDAQAPPPEAQPPDAGVTPTAPALQPAPSPPQPEPTASSAAAPPPSAPAPVPASPTTVIVEPAPVVVQQAPATTTSGDTTSAALTGGAIGLFGGLALASLFDDDDDDWHGGYPYPTPYGGYAGAPYEDRKALQEDRQAAARQRQEDRQTAASDRQQQRQDAAGLSSRPQPKSGERPAQRPSAVQTTGAGADRRAGGQTSSPGANRRAAATGQARPSQPAIQRPAAAPARPAAAPQRAVPTPQRAAPPQRASGAEWGPTRGMSGGGRSARGGGGGGGRGRR